MAELLEHPESKREELSVNSFIKKYKRNEISFNNPYQRGDVWNLVKKSKYIHSILCGIADYQQPFLFNKKNEVRDVLDGQQRGKGVIAFENNDFVIIGNKKELMLKVDGKPYCLKNKRFSQLPECLKEAFLDFTISAICLLNANPEIEALYFSRVNGGQSMTKVDLSRSKNIHMPDMVKMRDHELFKHMFSDRKNYPEDKILVWSYVSLFEDKPNFSQKHFDDIMSNLNILDYKETIYECYDLILSAYKNLEVFDTKGNAIKVILKPTHFFSYLPFVSYFETGENLSQWMRKFYNNIPEEYKSLSRDGTTSLSAVVKRRQMVEESIMNFLN